MLSNRGQVPPPNISMRRRLKPGIRKSHGKLMLRGIRSRRVGLERALARIAIVSFIDRHSVRKGKMRHGRRDFKRVKLDRMRKIYIALKTNW